MLWFKSGLSAVEYCELSSTLQVLRCVVIMHGPAKGDDEEKERFWNNLYRFLDIVGNGYRL